MTINEKNTSDKTACIIVAGGSGSRLGGGEPKQFRTLGGEPVIAHSMRFFGNHPLIDLLVIVVPQGWIDHAEQIAIDVGVLASFEVVAGGQRRQDSVLAGINVARDCVYVAIHDGARPLPPINFDHGLRVARAHGAGIFAMPATDSIKLVQDDLVKHTVPRADLWAAQTPQIFLRSRLLHALHACDKRGAEITDDASAFEVMGWEVAIVPGSRSNIKITYPEDFVMAEALLKELSR